MFKPLQHSANFVAFVRESPICLMFLWLSALLVALLSMPASRAGLIGLTAFFGLAATYLLYHYTRHLARRIARDEPHAWDVKVNGVTVGRVSDAEYAALQRAVVLEADLYGRQLGNLGHVLARAASNLATIVPMVAFWSALLWLALDADGVRSALAGAAQASSAQLREAGAQLLEMLGIASFAALAVGVMMGTIKGGQLGLENVFEQALAVRLRHRVGCAADGDVSVARAAPSA